MIKLYSNREFFRRTLKGEQGIALLLVLGVVTILTILLADFTFEVKLNKIKVYNQQDKIQARLNAEAGLNFALAKLRLYQEGRNKIEKEETLKSAFPPSDLEAIITQPFMYPVPSPKNANIIQRTALAEFEKNTMIRGEIAVTFTKIAGFLNPNSLRLKKDNGQSKTGTSGEQDDAAADQDQVAPGDSESEDKSSDDTGSKTKESADKIIENKLTETIARLLKEKSDVDETFHTKYGNADAAMLIKELKFYVNDVKDYKEADVEAKFIQKNITPKHGPLASLDELYLLPSWDDAIVELIKDRLSVHEVSVIAVNELTIEDLKIIFPNINNLQIEEFFKYRDGDVDKKIEGKKFKNAEDFKNVIVGTLNITTESDYQERMTQLKNAGLVIDTAGKLYKINSRGSYNNGIFNIVAYIDLPIKPQPVKPKKPGQGQDQGQQGSQVAQDDSENPGPGGDKKEDKPEPIELLNPRVIELRVE
jgi:hypothetical protein